MLTLYSLKIDMSNYIPGGANKIHFIGIGGIGMSALARFFLHEGKTVSGSDRATSAITEALVAEGVRFFPTQSAENLSKGLNPLLPDIVVYTEAMAHNHPEMAAARLLGVPMMNYFDALALVANEYYLIAVAGTHGKSTTTAMLIDILEEAGYDPTAIVGAIRAKTKSNFRAGKSKYAIVEACEYKRDFMSLRPDVLVITNIEFEHVDYYKDLADVQSAFAELASYVSEEGAIITQTADKNIAPVIDELAKTNDGHRMTVIDYKSSLNLTLPLHQPGIHNRLNAAAATAVAVFLGIEPAVIDTALENFTGTWRRFEYKGDVIPVGGGRVPVYDDYAHHPTEIRATIAGVREKYPDKKLTVVFQSHTYSRTHELFNDFVTELAKADKIIMLPIYGAREENISGVTSEQLVAAIEKKGIETKFFETPEASAEFIKETVGQNEVVVVMGAGPVTEVAKLLTN